jgi:hypothetical protein
MILAGTLFSTPQRHAVPKLLTFPTGSDSLHQVNSVSLYATLGRSSNNSRYAKGMLDLMYIGKHSNTIVIHIPVSKEAHQVQ